MTDPLGQSQVIPYLKGLSGKGHEIHLISCEKKATDSKEFLSISVLLKELRIKWYPLKYTSTPPVFSTLLDIVKIKRAAKRIIIKNNIDIVHCRSYIAALVGLKMKKRLGTKFVFDMRGFWADERVDGKIWNLHNPLFKCVYNYFKKKEKQFLSSADYIICLTESGKSEILRWEIPRQPLKIQVIPCCADLELFDKNKINETERKLFAEKLKIKESDFVLSYIGSIGTWYMLDEMLDFFKVLLKKKENAKFLFITPENHELLKMKTSEKNIPENKIVIQKATRNEVPALLSLSHISIFFIKPVFSKKASSPSKMGEIMGLGIPLICNSNVGDVDKIINDTKAGALVNLFNDKEYERVINEIDGLTFTNPVEIRNGAVKYFSLQEGVEKYNNIYNELGG